MIQFAERHKLLSLASQPPDMRRLQAAYERWGYLVIGSSARLYRGEVIDFERYGPCGLGVVVSETDHSELQRQRAFVGADPESDLHGRRWYFYRVVAE